MNDIIFTTTDGYPVRIYDRYHIIDENGIQHWICEEDDPIPIGDTYRVFENAQDIKAKKIGTYTPNRNKGIFITEEKLENDCK